MKISLMILGVSALFNVCAASASQTSRPQVIRLIWVQTSIHTSGARASWTSRLENETRQFGKPAGAPVGNELGFSEGSRASGVVKLPGGVLEYAGTMKRVAGKGGVKLSITDGSGAFADAKGSYTLFGGDKTHPNDAILVLRLRYPRLARPPKRAR